jgi:hypothetical protein
MRFNILGFNQLKACENGLTIDELMILRHMHDFVSSGRMETVIKDNEMYYWIKYDKFIEDLPILNMKKTRLMEIFNNNLCEKPLDWETRYNGMSENSKKRAKSFKFAGVLKSFTKKDKTGTYSYFTFTKKFYDMLPSITNNDEENKKAPSTPIDEAYDQDIKKNNSSKSITQNKKNDTKNTKENMESNSNKSLALEIIENSCVNIKKADLPKCEEEFTDIDRLKKALDICENNGNNGIKALRLAYKKAYNNEDSPKQFIPNYPLNPKIHRGLPTSFLKYTPEELEKLLQEKQKDKFK